MKCTVRGINCVHRIGIECNNDHVCEFPNGNKQSFIYALMMQTEKPYIGPNLVSAIEFRREQ